MSVHSVDCIRSSTVPGPPVLYRDEVFIFSQTNLAKWPMVKYIERMAVQRCTVHYALLCMCNGTNPMPMHCRVQEMYGHVHKITNMLVCRLSSKVNSDVACSDMSHIWWYPIMFGVMFNFCSSHAGQPYFLVERVLSFRLLGKN